MTDGVFIVDRLVFKTALGFWTVIAVKFIRLRPLNHEHSMSCVFLLLLVPLSVTQWLETSTTP